MSQPNYQEDLSHIRSIMERTTRFMSLSGWSGTLAGLYAIGGAYAAHYMLNRPGGVATWILFALAAAVLGLSLLTGLIFSYRRARRLGVKLADSTGKRLAANLVLFLSVGGIFTLGLYYSGYFALLAPSMLVFYGLTLLHCSKFTVPELRWLGLAEVVLGLISLFLPGHGLLFWVLGFGALHVLYGILLTWKYER